MHSETFTPPFLGHAPPSRSTLQPSRSLTCEGDCHLEHRHYIAAPGCGSAIVDAWEPQCLVPLSGVDYAVSISEVLQSSSCPITPTPPLVCNSSLVGHLRGEPDSAPVALLLGCIAGENRALSIGFSLVDHARGYWDTQGYTSDCITNHDTTLPPSYTSPLPPYAIEQSPGYPQESGNISTFVDLDSSFSGPSMCLGPIPSPHHCTSGQVIVSDAPSSWLSSPLFPSLQGLHPSDDLTIGDNPLPPEQTQVEIVVPSQFLSSSTAQLTTQIRPRTPSPYTYPNPSQSDSTSYSISITKVPETGYYLI